MKYSVRTLLSFAILRRGRQETDARPADRLRLAAGKLEHGRDAQFAREM